MKPGGSDGKEVAWNAWDVVSILGSGRSPKEGNGNPLQFSFLENSMDRSLMGYSTWGCKELDKTESLTYTYLILCESIFIPLKIVVNSIKHIFIIKKILKELTWDFPGGTVDKNPPADAGDTGSIPGPGRFHMLQSS